MKSTIKTLAAIAVVVVIISSCYKEPVDYSKDINDLKALVTELQHRSDSLATALGNTNTNLSNLSKSVDSIKLKLTDIQTQIDALTLSLTTANANIAAINAQLVLLNQQYASLLEQLNAILALLNSTPAATLSNGLVAYYPFTGNAGDSSGNGNHATNYGASLTTDRFGNSDNAYNFDGSSNYMDVPYTNSIAIQSSFSSSVWINMSGGGCNPRIYELHEVLDCGGYNLNVVGTDPTNRIINGQFLTCSGNGTSINGNTYNVSVGTWHHVSVTVDGTSGNGKLYIDGNLVYTIAGTPITNLNYYGASLTIGNINAGRCDWWGGKIDELRLYNRVLTESEITYLATH